MMFAAMKRDMLRRYAILRAVDGAAARLYYATLMMLAAAFHIRRHSC